MPLPSEIKRQRKHGWHRTRKGIIFGRILSNKRVLAEF